MSDYFLRDEDGKRTPNPNLQNINLDFNLDFFDTVCSDMGLQKTYRRNTFKLDEIHYLEFILNDPLDIDFKLGKIINNKRNPIYTFSVEKKEDVYTIGLCLLDAIRRYWADRDSYSICLSYWQYNRFTHGEHVEWLVVC